MIFGFPLAQAGMWRTWLSSPGRQLRRPEASPSRALPARQFFNERNTMFRIATLLVIAVLFAGFAAAQSGQGEIAGLIKDASGAAVPNAPLILVNQDSGVQRVTRSDNDGRYLFAAVPPGRYSIKI